MREGRYDEAGRIQNGEIPAIQDAIAAAELEEVDQRAESTEPMIAHEPAGYISVSQNN